LDKETLVKTDLDVGRRITEALDQTEIKLRGSLWLFDKEEDDWRLILVTSLVDSRGPMATYAMVQRALAKAQLTSELSLRKISVMSPNDALIKTLRTALRTGPGMHAVRVTKTAINNTFIEDVLVYRVLHGSSPIHPFGLYL
jgi:hypothetical protein